MEDLKDTAVGIKTFLRPSALDACLASLCGISWKEVIIADDNGDSLQDEYTEVYRKYDKWLPLHVVKLPFGSGLAKGRNAIVTACSSKYIMIMDDDLCLRAGVHELRSVLEDDESLGGVSCVLIEDGRPICNACDLFIRGGYVIKEMYRLPEVKRTVEGARYMRFDFIQNCTLFRRSCLEELPWDPKYIIGKEHVDFFLRHKMYSQWGFALCLESYAVHRPSDRGQEYDRFRRGEALRESEEYFRDKFGVRDVVEGRKLVGGREVFTLLESFGASTRIANGVSKPVHELWSRLSRGNRLARGAVETWGSRVRAWVARGR